jgi:VacB/RNase II family 3'-5' exoribonuclease
LVSHDHEKEQTRGGFFRQRGAHTHKKHDTHHDHQQNTHKNRRPYQKRENIVYEGKVSFLSEKDGLGYIERTDDQQKFKFLFTPGTASPAKKDSSVTFTPIGGRKGGIEEAQIMTVIDPLDAELQSSLRRVVENIYQCKNLFIPQPTLDQTAKQQAIFALHSHLSRERIVPHPGILSSFEQDLKQRESEISTMLESLAIEKIGIRLLLENIIPQVGQQSVQQQVVHQPVQRHAHLDAEPAHQNVHQLLEDVQQKISTGDYVNAVQHVSEIVAKEKIPNSVLCNLYQLVLEGVPYGTATNVPENIRYAMLGLMSDAMNRNRGPRGAELMAQQRKICILYGQRLNIRRYDIMTKILNQIVRFGPPVQVTLPRLTRPTYLDWQELQTYISALLISSPKDSYKILSAYKSIKDRMQKEEERRKLILREASMGAIVTKKQQQFVQPEPVQADSDTQDDEEDEEDVEDDEEDDEEDEDVDEEEDDEEDDSIVIQRDDQFTREIMTQYRALEPTQEEVERKKALASEIQEICGKVFGNNPCTVHTYGSSVSGFGLRGSDIDMCIKFDEEVKDSKMQAQLLKLLEKAIDSDLKAEYGHLSCKEERGVIRSRVPILKIVDAKRSCECDICIENFLGVVNTRMLQLYSQLDERVKPLVYAIKHWTKRRHISDPPSGSLSSYSHVLMVIHYLQTVEVLPSLQDMTKLDHVDEKTDFPQPHFWNAYDCRYFSNVTRIKQVFPRKNNSSVGDLLAGFFRYYGAEFNFAQQCIAIRDLGTQKQKLTGSAISIEDPFEGRDLGLVISNEMGPKIIAEYRRAHSIITSQEVKNTLDVICEERADTNNEVNIYQLKQDYEDYMAEEQVDLELRDSKLYRGVLRVNKKRFREAFVTIEGFERDVLVDGFKARNRALHGDIVAVKIEDTQSHNESGQLSATVVRILEKKSPTYFACSIMKEDVGSESKGFRWLCPIDKSYPKIMVHFEEFRHIFNTRASELEDIIFIAEINQPWKQTQHYPKGRVHGTVGLRKDMWSQKRAILMQNVPNLWNPIIEKKKIATSNDQALVPSDIQITDQLLREYRDCRQRRIFTIDPTSSRDLDDALSITSIGNGQYLIGVYIADVDRFVKEGDANDVEARKRGTSVYMIDSVEHMLDPVLSQNLASLHAGVTRFSLSVEFIMNDKGELVEETKDNNGNVGVFHRDIINSCCRLDYDQVQAVIDGKEKETKLPSVHAPHTWTQIHEDLITMNSLAQKLRKKRHENNSLFLSNEEMYFEMDPTTGYPSVMHHSDHSESHQLVEEFMLVANQLAARALVKHFPEDALLRNHPSPDREKWTNTITKLTNSFVKTHKVAEDDPMVVRILEAVAPKSTVPVQHVMNDVVDFAKRFGTTSMQTAQHCLMREMQLAKYVRRGDSELETYTLHFALNMLHYTHFTSPIRRYADVVVHRMILAMLKNEKPKLHGGELSMVALHLNDQAYRAKTAQENAQRAYLSFYLLPQLPKQVERTEAVVVSLGRRSFTIFVPKYCVEINCNVMSQFSPAPDSISSVDKNNVVQQQTEEHHDEEGRNIEELNLVWNTARPNINLTVMKEILIDMDINYDIMPYDVYVYAVWDMDQKRKVRVNRRVNPTVPQSNMLNLMLKNKAQEEQQMRRKQPRSNTGRNSRTKRTNVESK